MEYITNTYGLQMMITITNQFPLPFSIGILVGIALLLFLILRSSAQKFKVMRPRRE